jgi:hypothetical protein
MRKLFRLGILVLAAFGAKALYDQYGAQIRALVGQFTGDGGAASVEYPDVSAPGAAMSDQDIAI